MASAALRTGRRYMASSDASDPLIPQSAPFVPESLARRAVRVRLRATVEAWMGTSQVGRSLMTKEKNGGGTNGMLRWLAESHDRAQAARLRVGEQIRAIVQGRDESWGEELVERDADELLKRIRKGEEAGPVPLLGAAYRRYWLEELEMARLLDACLEDHPAWPWLRHVRGVGTLLAGKLLARLDIGRAETPSAFWAYCGLATIPGIEYHCTECGLTAAFSRNSRVSGYHKALNSRRRCSGTLLPTGRADVRIAQTRVAGEKLPFDQTAKKLCYLAGVSFLRVGGPYEQFYRSERRKLDGARSGWVEKRKHLTALRKTQKLFLAHLWAVWREATGLPLTDPYCALRGDFQPIDPWEMVGEAALTSSR
jgi:hypothetical protein